MDFDLTFGIAIIIIAFLAEYTDSTIGMGYGTILTPVLLLLGFEPLRIVPAVLFSEFVTGLLAGFTHHSMGNVDFRPRSTNLRYIIKRLNELGYVEGFKRGIPLHLKAALLIASCSIIGTLTAVFIAINITKYYLTLYIGILILTIGVVILKTINSKFGFSWKKMTFLGLIASFNKGISGGGYGPVVAGGQILAGVDEKNAIGITSLAEGLTCFFGVIAYILTGNKLDWSIALYLVIGAILSVPLGAYTVRKMETKRLRIVIGIATTILGIFTIGKVVL